MASMKPLLRELQGPLLPVKDLVEESDDYLKEEDEEDVEPAFVDAEELCSGGLKAGSLPGRLWVVISDENTQEKCEVLGRFPLTGPWWRVKVQVKNVRSRNYQAQGFPSYFLQSDMSPPNQKHICSLFLKDCNVSSDNINKFLSWVDKVSSYKDLNFENLRETLRTFYKELGRNGQKQSTQTEQEESQPDHGMCHVENTIPFINVMTALQFPKIMEFLPVLLPRHFKQLISSGSKEVLEKIEEILGACPWKLGFSKAERDIASSVGDLMMRPPWHLHIDVKKVLASLCTTKPENSRSDDTLNESKPDETSLETSVDIPNTQDTSGHIWDTGENEDDAEISDNQLDQDQVAALEMICSNAVTIISGKGGCGKTTIVSHLFKHIELLEEREVKKACEDFEQDQDVPEEWISFTEQSPLKADKAIEVLLTAPTGKAAGLLRQKTGFSAYTLCQVNFSFYLWDRKSTKDIPWKFSSVKVLVVDEGSLVSVGVFRAVLYLLLEHSKLSKLIILGDIRQLPSIEPGNLLKDLFETLKSRNCAIELKTNHRAESELIVDNATRISKRQYPKFDAELNISDNSTLPVSVQDKTFIFVRLPEDNASSQSSKSNHQSDLYSAVTTLLKEKDLQCAETSQFIAFRRQDCDIINACCCKHYTGHLVRDHKNRLIFGVGDKICCTKNAYLSDLLPENTSSSQQNKELEASGEVFNGTAHGFAKNKHDFESDIRLCNGEIFFITHDKTDITSGKKRLLTINNRAGLEVTVNFKKLMQNCHIRHSWARTIHTFQGSEEQTVVYVLGKAGRQHWQHVYTAVTRGRCKVYVIAEESELRRAISRNNVQRKTRLKYFLQNELSTTSASPADFTSPSKSSGDSGGRSPQPSLLLPTGTADFEANHAPGGGAAAADGETFAFAGGWILPLSDEVDTDEDLSKSRGSKRICGMNDAESPSKLRMVEESSPQVSSKLQNLKLNSLTPRQLFKSTDNQES
ncbi:DNA helicase B isoform X2 [Rousettus aegyptiacus]|uniref:DNA helicase B isoform X2 n=1 Tax=Rousettus aegyptiacus TaxID=9407 RepID=UPI00168CBB0B|nr:DNA helicase B isoform X2 [Rousettus aegyptiacus]